MAKKGKKLLKKLAKAALIGGALYGGSKLLKGAKGYKNVHETGAITQTPGSKWGPWKGGKEHIPGAQDFDPHFYAGVKEGGRISKKGGGIAKRGMGAAFKKGGHVKSMGIAKRGGGAAKR